jgi:hypothetical protein
MDDFSALAETLATGVGDTRGSLIVSRDGLVLGAHPADAERLVKPAWLRFATLGEPERGFLQFGTEIWCYVRRGAYAAFVVTGTAVRPGLVIDRIEQVLLLAEEARARREGARTPEPATPAAAPLSKPRTPLHPEQLPGDQPIVIRPAAAAAGTEAGAAAPAMPVPPPGPEDAEPAPAGGSEPLAEPAAAEAGPTAGGEATEVPPPPTEPASVWASGAEEESEEIDRFSIAREFSRLLQRDPDGADG